MSERLPNPLITLAGILLVFFSVVLAFGGPAAQLKSPSDLALSTNQSRPDAAPSTQEPAKPFAQPSTFVAPWQGPVMPVTIPANGSAPVFSQIPVTEPVVFLGIDDGWYQSPDNLQWLKSHHLPFSLFVVNSQISDNYDYFKQLQAAGMTIEDHTMTHPDLTTLQPPDQQSQICGAADTYAQVFGRRPLFTRPPYGDYNATTQQAAAACGIKALINWHVVLSNGTIQYQVPSTQLEPGDIILAHFQADLIPNMNALNAQLKAQHLQLGRLEDWLH